MTANPTTSPKRSLDCHAVAREQIAERYVTGELSDPDREAFEEHYFHCERCFDELKTVQLIADELRRSEVELERPAAEAAGRRVDPGQIAFEPEMFRETVTKCSSERQFRIAPYGCHCRCERDTESLVLSLGHDGSKECV